MHFGARYNSRVCICYITISSILKKGIISIIWCKFGEIELVSRYSANAARLFFKTDRRPNIWAIYIYICIYIYIYYIYIYISIYETYILYIYTYHYNIYWMKLTYMYVFRCIPVYSGVFRCIPVYSGIFRCIPVFSRTPFVRGIQLLNFH